MMYMFTNCESLTSIDLHSFDTRSLESIYDMFTGCKKLKVLDLSSFNTTNIDHGIHNFFSFCPSLEYIDLSPFSYDMTIHTGPFGESGTMIVKKEFYEHLTTKPSNWRIIFVD